MEEIAMAWNVKNLWKIYPFLKRFRDNFISLVGVNEYLSKNPNAKRLRTFPHMTKVPLVAM